MPIKSNSLSDEVLGCKEVEAMWPVLLEINEYRSEIKESMVEEGLTFDKLSVDP